MLQSHPDLEAPEWPEQPREMYHQIFRVIAHKPFLTVICYDGVQQAVILYPQYIH
jgi:hypothetical protein